MTEAQRMGRGKWWVVATLVAGALSALTVVLALAAPWRSIPPGVTNLSQKTDLDSYIADVAVSPDGDRVAVVWVEEDAFAGVGGSVWLRWASENGDDGWSPRVPVFTGTDEMQAIRSASVAVTGTTAHVAYIANDVSGGYPTQTGIFYVICHLTVGGSCDAAQEITSTLYSLGPSWDQYFSGVDVALDRDGKPYFAYGHVSMRWTDRTTVTVYYYEGESQVEERVPDSGVEGIPLDEYDWSGSGVPAIAWSDEFAHVVWEEQTTSGIDIEIRHNRRNIISGTWEHPATDLVRLVGNLIQHPRNPDIAAYRDRVVVTWDWQWTEEQAGTSQYALAYTHYVTGVNEGWLVPYEVGTRGAADRLIGEDVLREMLYYSYTSTSNVLASSRRDLQPSISLDREGLPTVIWHANNGTYDIMYSRALSVAESAGDVIFSWSEPDILYWPSTGESVSPAAAQAPVVSPTLHVAYLHNQSGVGEGDWETYYVGREAGYTLPDLGNVFLPVVMRNHYSGPE